MESQKINDKSQENFWKPKNESQTWISFNMLSSVSSFSYHRTLKAVIVWVNSLAITSFCKRKSRNSNQRSNFSQIFNNPIQTKILPSLIDQMNYENLNNSKKIAFRGPISIQQTKNYFPDSIMKKIIFMLCQYTSIHLMCNWISNPTI